MQYESLQDKLHDSLVIYVHHLKYYKKKTHILQF